ncbi:MAG: MFS transporter [Hyphomicrobiales bacterium]
MPQTSSTLSTTQTGLFVLAPFALGFFLSNMLAAVNAIVAPDLVRDIGLSASELGFVTSAYLFGFALFQVPLGLLLDRYGPRIVQAVLVCVSALGTLLFSWVEGLAGLFLARMLIGLGSAGALMAGFKAVTLWVPEQRWALANGVIAAAGGLGFFAATLPTDFLVQQIGWRGLFEVLCGLALGVAAIIYFAVPRETERAAPEPLVDQLRATTSIYTSKVFWIVAPLAALTLGVHFSTQTLWAGPWMRDIAGLARDGVAQQLGIMALAFLIGTFVIGVVGDWLGRKGVSLLTAMAGILGLFFVTQIAIIVQVPGTVPVGWFFYGLLGQAGILAYPWLAAHFGTQLAARANTALNLFAFVAAFVVQYAFGMIIDLWPQTTGGGYAPQGYQAALGICLGVQILAFVWFMVRRHKISG